MCNVAGIYIEKNDESEFARVDTPIRYLNCPTAWSPARFSFSWGRDAAQAAARS